MKVELTTSSYNVRRYGKPYIAKVDFSDPKGVPAWGDWIGHAGDAGLLSIEVSPGEIIMQGQRDNRNMKHSAPSYGKVNASGKVDWFDTKTEAYKAWQAARVCAADTTEVAACESPSLPSCPELVAAISTLLGYYIIDGAPSTIPIMGPSDKQICDAWMAALAAIEQVA